MVKPMPVKKTPAKAGKIEMPADALSAIEGASNMQIMRVTVLTIIRSSATPVCSAQLKVHPNVVDLKMDDHKVDTVLTELWHKYGYIKQVTGTFEGFPKSKTGYIAIDIEGNPLPLVNKTKPRAATQARRTKSGDLHAVKIDVIEGTNRLRIQYHDLVVEIGTVKS